MFRQHAESQKNIEAVKGNSPLYAEMQDLIKRFGSISANFCLRSAALLEEQCSLYSLYPIYSFMIF
jgi:hypothetical protein